MNKKTIIVSVIILMTAVIAGGFWYGKSQDKNNVADSAQSLEDTQKKQGRTSENVKGIEELNFDEVDTSDWKTYRNDEYGFEMKLPGDILKWKLKEEYVSQGNSFYNSNDERVIYLNYALDNNIVRDTHDLSMGQLNDMSVWYIDIVPVKDYVENVCEKYKKPLCRQGELLGQNNKFVFVGGFINVEGAGYLCLEESDEQKEFCNVNDFFAIDNIKELLEFNNGEGAYKEKNEELNSERIGYIEDVLWNQVVSNVEDSKKRRRESFIIEAVNGNETVAIGFYRNQYRLANEGGGANIFASRENARSEWNIDITQEGLLCVDTLKFTKEQMRFIKEKYVDYCVEFDNNGSMHKKNL